MKAAILAISIAIYVTALPSFAEELTAERLRELSKLPDDRLVTPPNGGPAKLDASKVPEPLRLYPVASAYTAIATSWRTGEKPTPPTKVSGSEKLVAGKYLLTTVNLPDNQQVLMTVHFDNEQKCYHKTVLQPDGKLLRMIGTRAGTGRSLAWSATLAPGVTIVSHEEHGDAESVWRELIVENGKVIAGNQGRATPVKPAS